MVTVSSDAMRTQAFSSASLGLAAAASRLRAAAARYDAPSAAADLLESLI